MPVRVYRFILLASIATLALLAAGARHAFAQQNPLQATLSNTQGLDFGRFVAGSGGTVVLVPGRPRSSTGGVLLLSSPNASLAGFNVGLTGHGGGNHKEVKITLPPNGTVRLTSGAHSMAVDTFVSSPETLPSIPNGGTTLSVGATLVVAPNQPAGDYSGTFSVTVNYQ
ncbi:MAG: DUF4402 domain-containing protein [Telluria sp.]